MSAYDTAVLADGPVGFWKLDEASGTVAHDTSGNGNDGTLSGSFALAATGIGDGETACNFTGGKLTIADAAPIRLGAGSFTVECWINLSALSGLTALWDDAATVYSMILNDGGGNGVAFYAGHGALNEKTLSTTLTTSALYHFVYVLDHSGPTATIYVNGTSRYSGTPSQGATNSTDGVMFCGSSGAFGAVPAQGVGSKFALYNTPLSGARVAAHYSAAQSTTFSDSPTGSITLTGTRTEAKTGSNAQSGALTLAGSNSQSLTHTSTRPGALVLAGSATDARTGTDSQSGSLILTGTTTVGAIAANLTLQDAIVTYLTVTDGLVTRLTLADAANTLITLRDESP